MPPPTASRRLLKELSDFRKYQLTSTSSDTDAVISLAPVADDDLFLWIGRVRGPGEGAWEGLDLDVTIRVDDSYPLKPPKMSFAPNTVFHPNVTLKTGEICLDVLKSAWSPAWTLASALLAVQGLLASPEPSSPLNVDAANLVRCEDWVAFAGLARMYFETAQEAGR